MKKIPKPKQKSNAVIGRPTKGHIYKNVSLHPEFHYKVFMELGDGNLSVGVQRAAQIIAALQAKREEHHKPLAQNK